MPASGGRKTRRRSCLPSCFSPSVVFDPDDSPALLPDNAPGRSPESFLRGVRRQNKTVPLLEDSAVHGDRRVEEGGEIKREVSPAASCHEGMPEKQRKEEKRCRYTGTKPLTHKPISTCSNVKRSNNQNSSINIQPTTTLHRVNRRGPVQPRAKSKAMHIGSSDPTRPIGSTRSSSSLDILIGLKMVAMMLIMILIGGKIFAIFITTLWFYFLSCVSRSQSQMIISLPKKI